MPSPIDTTHLLQSLETQVDHLTEQLTGALGLLHSAAIERHYALHGGHFTACREAQCQKIRTRLAKYRPPSPPEVSRGTIYHLDGHQVTPEIAK